MIWRGSAFPRTGARLVVLRVSSGPTRAGAVVVHVGKWLATATGEGVTLYITSTEASMALSVSGHRAEFFVGFEPEEDEVASSLALLAKEALSVEIDHGHTIESMAVCGRKPQ
jgi:hypothetical protein